MLQRQFWNILCFGLLSSFVIYNVNFGGGRVHAVLSGSSSSGSSSRTVARLSPLPGKQNVLITSGPELATIHLALAFLEEGHAVTVLNAADSCGSTDKQLHRLLQSSSSSSSAVGRLHIVSCDISKNHQLAEVLVKAAPDAVVLLAGSAAGVSDSSTLELLSISHRVLSLLSAISNSTVSKLLVSSSLAVYGQAYDAPVTEERTCCKPATIQGHAAQLVEAAVQAYAAATPSFSAATLRHGTVIGAPPRAKSDATSLAGGGSDVMRRCLAAAAAGAAAHPSGTLQGVRHQHVQQQQPHEVQLPAPPGSADPDAGGGRAAAPATEAAAAAAAAAAGAAGLEAGSACLKQEYVHVTDLAAAFVAAVNAVSNPPAVYNVGSGRAYSEQEVWSACHKVFGIKPQANRQLPDSAEACPGITADTAKFTALTGWRPKYQLEDALMHALQWQQGAAAQAQQ